MHALLTFMDDSATGIELAIRETRKRLSRAWVWDRFSLVTAVGWWTAAAVILLGKVTMDSVARTGVVITLLAPLAALLFALPLRKRATRLHGALLLDRAGGLGGWPLLQESHPRNPWLPSKMEVHEQAARSIPRLSLLPFLRRLVLPALFLLITLLIPRMETGLFDPHPTPNSAGQRELARLNEELEEFEKEELLPEREIEELRKEFESLTETVEGEEMGRETWEAIDHLAENMNTLSREGTAALSRAAACADRFERSLDKEMDESKRREEEDALMDALAMLGNDQKLGALKKELQKKGAAGNNASAMDPEKAREALKELKEYLNERLRQKPGSG